MNKLFGRTKTYTPVELIDKLEKNITLLVSLPIDESTLDKDSTAIQLTPSDTSAAGSGDNLNNPQTSPTTSGGQSTSSSSQSKSAKDKEFETARNNTAKYLESVKQSLVKPSETGQDGGSGSINQEQASAYAVAIVDQLLSKKGCSQDGLLLDLLNALPRVTFESKKEIAAIFGALVRPIRSSNPNLGGDDTGRTARTAQYINNNPKILQKLINNYESNKSDVALNSGAILRDCIKNVDIARTVLENYHQEFFKFANLASFDILSDAFSTFRDLMTRHKQMVKEFLETRSTEFFKEYSEIMIKSDNYVTKRQSIKLISEVLLDRANFQIMSKYVSDVDNLRVIMELLCDRSDAIKFEAFHVFKIFVANPNKAERVERLLIKNQNKLIEFLSDFQVEARQDDEQFQDERTYLIRQIRTLQPKQQQQSTTTTTSSNTTSSPENKEAS